MRSKGTLIQHLKEHMLMSDLKPHDVIFYYTTVRSANLLFRSILSVSLCLFIRFTDRLDDVQLAGDVAGRWRVHCAVRRLACAAHNQCPLGSDRSARVWYIADAN